ncbi:hypothetical protein G647_07774 [Cladophialophora carrionii CBS 160.54]|uniref:Uncharacterized protein n=1 Tax=Cladophialophora carrionii CBS 160.54 TaxID=1279043 RepID=V9D630_9EURO|nr:uncharacterized protein G647_07774 [Cladophialophora carrionii CBS 160.54]ETI21427.1 hypothetical protein G647_07774 [Cladophialophora carrionii CBS 160.54]
MEQTTPEKRVRMDKMPAPPAETRSPRRSSRVKKNPSITPNRFNKFFHPRLQDTKNKSVRTSRKALQKLSAANLNSRLKGNKVTLAADEEDGPPSKRRRLSFSSIPSIPSSPVTKSPASQDNARTTGAGLIGVKGSPGTCLGLDDDDNDDDDDDDEYLDEDELECRPRVTRYKSLSSSAGNLSRQLGGRGILRQANDSKLWQNETGNFYTLPDDVFTNSTNTTRERSLPFCATSFHQQESVAIGNEDGQIEIYRAWPRVEGYDGSLKFEGRMIPHDNAIMDMQFSPDDHFLATASGDQTCRIIDMNTRTGTHTLVGHVGSIKNVRWQPASGNKILATCSRDGSVCLWDLRCAQNALGSLKVKPLTRSPHFLNNSREVVPQTEIVGAHTPWDKVKLMNSKRPSAPLSSKADFAVTACAFISETRPHMLATASEHNAIIKLWDLRASYKQRSGRPIPVSATAEPKSHELTRPFGVTSIVMSTDGARLYTLCRDNTIYAYSTAHLVLGGSPGMNPSSTQAFKASRSAGTGLGPLYGFRHEKLRLGSFYDKLSLRPKTDENTELLAAGTGEDCAVLFPTDERYLAKAARTPFPTTRASSSTSNHPSRASLPQRASASKMTTSFTLHSNDPEATHMYHHGTPLINGHRKEVSCCAWIPGNGQLVTIADDYVARCWYEDDPGKARELRSNTGRDVARAKSGWAAVVAGWDEED